MAERTDRLNSATLGRPALWVSLVALLPLLAAPSSTRSPQERDVVTLVDRSDHGKIRFARNDTEAIFSYDVVYDTARDAVFNKPSTRAAVRPDGTLYLYDRGDGDIKVLSPGGDLIGTVGGQGQGPGEWSGLFAVSWSSAGELWVRDERAKRFLVYTEDGEYKRTHTLGMPLVHCVDFALLKSELVAAGNTFEERGYARTLHVFSVDPDERELSHLSSFAEAPSYDPALYPRLALASLAVDHDGNLLTSLLGKFSLRKFSADGRLMWQVESPPLFAPVTEALSVTDTGSVHLGQFAKIRLFLPAGEYYLAQVDYPVQGTEEVERQLREAGGVVDPSEIDFSGLRASTDLLFIPRSAPTTERLLVPAGRRGARLSFINRTDREGRIYALEHRPNGYPRIVRGRLEINHTTGSD